AAGGIVAGPDAWEAGADVEDLVPVREFDPAIDAELEQFHRVDGLLHEVGIDRLGITALRMDGGTAPLLGLATERAIERPVVRVDLLAFQGKIIAPEEVEMAISRAAVFLSGGDRDFAPADDRGLAQPVELGSVHRLHRAGVRPGRLVV